MEICRAPGGGCDDRRARRRGESTGMAAKRRPRRLRRSGQRLSASATSVNTTRLMAKHARTPITVLLRGGRTSRGQRDARLIKKPSSLTPRASRLRAESPDYVEHMESQPCQSRSRKGSCCDGWFLASVGSYLRNLEARGCKLVRMVAPNSCLKCRGRERGLHAVPARGRPMTNGRARHGEEYQSPAATAR